MFEQIEEVFFNIDGIIEDKNLFEETLFDLKDYKDVFNDKNKELLQDFYIVYNFLVYLYLKHRQECRVYIPKSISNPLFEISDKIKANVVITDELLNNYLFKKIVDSNVYEKRNKIKRLLEDLDFPKLRQIGECLNNNILINKFVYFELKDVCHIFLRTYDLDLIYKVVKDKKDVILFDKMYDIYTKEMIYVIKYYIYNNVKNTRLVKDYLYKLNEILEHMCTCVMEGQEYPFVSLLYKRIGIIEKQLRETSLPNLLAWQNIIN
jgi:hypothetical protein